MALYDTIGVGYDSTRRADPYILSRLLHHLQPSTTATYLDVGCGTGNYTIAVNEAGVRIVAIDASLTMLSRAHQKCPELGFHNARADVLPFRGLAFAGAICTFVHHHLPDPVAAFAEVRRVLLPGAKLVIFNCTVEQIRHYWLWEYFPNACAQALEPYERLDTEAALCAAGFQVETSEPYTVHEDLQDWFMMCGKYHPERYLDPHVRAGISSFAAARDQREIETGIERLRADIASKRIAEIQRAYDWDGGDYMFTVATT